MPPVSGPQWRSLLADPARAAAGVPRAWPPRIARPQDRRRVLKLMAAEPGPGRLRPGRSPDSHLIPAVIAPPQIVAGLPNVYATANVTGGLALGITVEHQMGRPLKVEGNPNHPSSLGATDALAQAAILDFYDPDRSGAILHARASPPTVLASGGRRWPGCASDLAAQDSGAKDCGSLDRTRCPRPPWAGRSTRCWRDTPAARWAQWEPVRATRARDAGGRRRPVWPPRRRAAAGWPNVDVLLALDSDLLASGARPRRPGAGVCRAAQPRPRCDEPGICRRADPRTLIGAAADHRFVANPGGDRGDAIEAMDAASQGGPAAGVRPAWLAPGLGRPAVRYQAAAPWSMAGRTCRPDLHALTAAGDQRRGWARETAPWRVVESPFHGAEAGPTPWLSSMLRSLLNLGQVDNAGRDRQQPGCSPWPASVRTDGAR